MQSDKDIVAINIRNEQIHWVTVLQYLQFMGTLAINDVALSELR